MVAVKDKAAEKAIERAADAIDVLAERAKDALHRMARQAENFDTGELGGSAWGMAERARSQAAHLAGDLYSRSQRSARAVRGQIEEQPWIALAIVGAVAVMLGYALKNRPPS
jgi:ElaB/YqjD/DUF883 family membrane-anchored ribosome-binding protein